MISVEERYAVQMIRGEKTVEVRRRVLHVAPGCQVWIYAKAPIAEVVATAVVEELILAKPEDLWRSHRDHLGISRREYRQYLEGVRVACGLLLRDVQELGLPVTLGAIRGTCRGFQPPQFFRRLHEDAPELTLLRAALDEPSARLLGDM